VERPPFSVSSACHGRPNAAEDVRANFGFAADGAGLDEIYRSHGPGLLSYLRRYAGNDAASDLMHDVFVRLAGSPRRHGLANPGGFLRRIAQNLLIDRARKHKRDGVVLFPLQEDHDVVSAPEQENGLAANDLLRTYEQAVEAMPEKTRRVFLLRRVDGLSYREIHERLGIEVATVDYHMVKALRYLSDALEIRR